MGATTITFQSEIQAVDFPFIERILNSLKATTKVIKEEKDETLMTKEAFFAKIDRARAGEKIQKSREEMKKLMFDKWKKNNQPLRLFIQKNFSVI